MHLNRTCITILLAAVLLTSCHSPNHKDRQKKPVARYENLEVGKLLPRVKIKTDTTLSYALYLPTSYDVKKENTILFIFDAHGRGALPLKKYQTLAEKYNLVLAASNDSKNGQSGQVRNRIITAFMGDVERKIHVNNHKMYTAGFSGGARIATLVALYNNTVAGVIECAAGFPQVQNPVNKSFTWIGVVGNRDFNFLELKNLYRQLQSNQWDSHLLVFDGKHDWPPTEVMDASLALLLGQSNNSQYQFQNSLEGDKLENKEVEQQRMLARAMEEKSLDWWIKETNRLLKESRDNPSKEVRLMNERLVNYISMISYIFTNRAFNSGNLEQAGKFITIYQKADPDNPDLYFFRAVRFAMLKQDKEVISSLQRAIDKGLDDLSQIKTNKAFDYLHGNPAFDQLLQKVEK